ncbi:phage tail protein [Escherichia coli]|nr:phage tail protein [Escherichia coli]
MMAARYKTIITNAGTAALAAAVLPDGEKVTLTHISVGDGNGKATEPLATQTGLVREVWRGEVSRVSRDTENTSFLTAEATIPADTGGFWIREIGLFDSKGTLIAVGNVAEGYKPQLDEGSGREQVFRMVILLSNEASVNLTADSSTTMATQAGVADMIKQHEQNGTHPDATTSSKGFTQLSSATDSDDETKAATPKAVKAVKDLAVTRPTAALNVDLNTLGAVGHHGDYYQPSDAKATSAHHYPVTSSGTLAVRLGAWGACQQEYTTWNPPRKYIRTLTGNFNGSGPWSDWKEVAMLPLPQAGNASLTARGIVQLNSATDSDNEEQAATPKAVKAAMTAAGSAAQKAQQALDAATARNQPELWGVGGFVFAATDAEGVWPDTIEIKPGDTRPGSKLRLMSMTYSEGAISFYESKKNWNTNYRPPGTWRACAVLLAGAGIGIFERIA